MGYEKGFSDTVMIDREIVYTVGDITYGSQKTDIPIKTRGSKKVRHLPGMEECVVTIKVYDGIDPEHPGSINGFERFKSMHDEETTRLVSIGDVSEKMVVLNFQVTSEVDGLRSADVTLGISGNDDGSSSGS